MLKDESLHPMRTDHLAASAKFVAFDFFGSFLYLPVWWYTAGVVRTALFCIRSLQSWARSFGITIWFRNLFVPMYGQGDWFGRIISVVLRIAVILYYCAALTVIGILLLGLFLAWIVFPIAVGYAFVHQVIALSR